ncbi:hypothetical protein EVAR_62142_1 [Eumeta japonica]|uniref:Uncharacterized protein n=1 Tax=Eumeta variegata TaxID=151549 RepID=A0A4C1ZHW6_EUMVA|nr:hypothetical protein EVAR_62142_1 [Eumeta japonica]
MYVMEKLARVALENPMQTRLAAYLKGPNVQLSEPTSLHEKADGCRSTSVNKQVLQVRSERTVHNARYKKTDRQYSPRRSYTKRRKTMQVSDYGRARRARGRLSRAPGH